MANNNLFEGFMNPPVESDEVFFNTREILSSNEDCLLMICGASGSGKSYFEKYLIQAHDDVFFKLPQVTTRDPREGETNEYYFVSKDTYDYLQPKLIGRLNNFNGNNYGTIPVFKKNKINTIIVSTDAIKDIINLKKKNKLNCKLLLLMFEIDYENITSEGLRSDRDESFLLEERNNLRDIFEIAKEYCEETKIYKYEDKNRFARSTDIFEF